MGSVLPPKRRGDYVILDRDFPDYDHKQDYPRKQNKHIEVLTCETTKQQDNNAETLAKRINTLGRMSTMKQLLRRQTVNVNLLDQFKMDPSLLSPSLLSTKDFNSLFR